MILNKGLAQDVEQTLKDTKNIFKEDPVSLTGSIGANATLYNADGIAPRRDPFYWSFNANINVTLFNKVSMPLTAVITQQDKNYTTGGIDKYSQAFNQFGISPRYKWLTMHAGYRSLEFSEYTLSGAMFLGGGVEIKPEKSLVSGTALYGRFVKAIPQGGVDGIAVSVPAYERFGGGGKIKLGNDDHYGEFIFLKLKDNVKSLAFDTALSVTPQENQILGIGTKQKITKWLSFSADLAYSKKHSSLQKQ
ncbi:hypothetical protein [Aurantibacillus circumpalustris]|uniref:hypothetical protein n=1 Tax=Aurantibacillus circumpalustris TaxID=3036359 RepID=UPI00295A5C9B|nr:hypothetical protein [Aurantibacillus circumpalustris]